MPNITSFDRTNARALSKEFTQELSALAAKYGLKCVADGGTIGSTDLKLKFKFSVTSGDVKMDERKEFGKIAPLYGLTEADYGKTFTAGGTKYRLVGLKIARKYTQKYIAVGETERGARYKFTEEVFKKLA